LAQAARKERLATMGIYYDDEYDYEQHMRTVEQMNQVEPSGDLELFRVGSTAAVRSRTMTCLCSQVYLL